MTSLVEGLSVVLLLSRNVAQVAAFYRTVLGLPLQEEEHDGRHKHYACPLGSLYFTIQPSADLGAPDPDRRYDFLQLCFTVADLDAFLRHLQSQNVTALHAPQRFEHTTFITLLDPEGRHVRVMTPWQR
jgi:catechol 2,3-dioxygenase-like lactoylglutathione lyase family enzyme